MLICEIWIASGLYYLSELVEEHTVIAKRFLTRMIYAIIGAQALLCIIDGFPFKLSVMSIVSHFVYLLNLRRFPFVKLSEPLFISSCGKFTFLPTVCRSRKLEANSGLNSPRPHKPLLLVLPFFQHRPHCPSITLRPPQPPHLHRNRFLLRPPRLACSILSLRVPVRER